MRRVPKYVRNVNPKENPKKIYLIICEGKNNQTDDFIKIFFRNYL